MEEEGGCNETGRDGCVAPDTGNGRGRESEREKSW